MKKVMHLLSTSTFSGAENVVCQIIKLYENDKNIEMVYCSPIGEIQKTLNDKSIKSLPIKKFSFSEISKAVKKYQPDIIHAHDVKSSIIASLFYKKRIIVSHIHGNSDKMKKISPKSFLYFIASIKFNHIFWVSSSSLFEYKFYNYIKNKSDILTNIIDIKEIEKKSEEKINNNYDVIFVGRLTDIKNPQRMIKIIQKVANKIPNIRLAIVGDGILRSELEKITASYNLNSNVEFLGFQTNPYKFMKKSKLMILTSLHEGTPMCVLEAMSLGLPIVSTPTDGVVQMVKNNINGFMSNDDDDLADFIVKAITDEGFYKNLSCNVLKKIGEIDDIANYKNSLNKIYT